LKTLTSLERERGGGLIDASLLEELTDQHGKLRLQIARDMLLNPKNLQNLGFESLERALEFGERVFSEWRDFPEYILLEKVWVGKEPRDSQFLAVKCSKRGNDVYQRRIKTRLGFLDQNIANKSFFKIRDFQTDKKTLTSLLWVTLSCDPAKKNGDIKTAWETLGIDFNRFISALRRKYGKISYFRVWESYDSGFPHIHVILFFEDAQFTVFPYVDAENKLSFRISEKDQIASLWHSFVDVQAISSLRNVFTYMKKHQEKVILGLSGSIQQDEERIVGFDIENIKGLRTLFLCWIFRKRSFSISGDFRRVLSDLISHLHNSNMDFQVTLSGVVVREWVYRFVGVFSGLELGIPPFIWAKKLDRDWVLALLKPLGL
jgi:hypothetical protein